MIFLALAVACSLSIGMIFKYAGRVGMDRIELLTANYLAAVIVGLGLLVLEGVEGRFAWSPGVLAIGGVTGALFIAGFFLLSLATDLAGMGLAVGVMRVSVVIPFLASWLIWGETPSLAQAVGLLLAAAAFFLIARKDVPTARVAPAPVEPDGAVAPESVRTFGVLALVFLAGGLVDTMMKTFEETFAANNSQAFFLLMVFGVAFVIGLGIRAHAYARGARPQATTIAAGLVLGVVNYGSAEFLLRAIGVLSGPFVFPANNIAIVVGAALLGVLFWREHLSRLNWLGLLLACVALYLLNF
ncbi:MAG: hypothetical protein ACOCTG_05935 [Bacteroidota bacterium]